jgi:5-methylcytosine-specific restriction enzyme A
VILETRVGGSYSRKTLWRLLRPGEDFPRGGSWLTDYVIEGDLLIIFANLGVPGKTGRNFPNQYESETGIMKWFGKPDAHSAQPTFKELFTGRLTPHVFVRWTNKKPEFTYLGIPSISKFDDGVRLPESGKTIMLFFQFQQSADDVKWMGPAGLPAGGVEGGKSQVTVNRYERDPRLRMVCIDHFGVSCQVCGFNFEEKYGNLGEGFCHVHHLRPLSEIGGQTEVNPIKDLIPICANCHAMLHARSPAIPPEELRSMLADIQEE